MALTFEEYQKFIAGLLKAKPSKLYLNRYDSSMVFLSKNQLREIPIPFGVVSEFICSNNKLETLENAPIIVKKNFKCHGNLLKNLDYMPTSIGGFFYCENNPLENVDALLNVSIGMGIKFLATKESQLDWWFQVLNNTKLEALEYHFANHKYAFSYGSQELKSKLIKYVRWQLSQIITIKRIENTFR